MTIHDAVTLPVGSAVTLGVTDDPPRVLISVPDALAGRTPDNTGDFLFTRSGGDLSRPLTINVSAGGTAADTDYVGLWGSAAGGSVVFPEYSTGQGLLITPLSVASGEPDKTLRLTILGATDPSLGTYQRFAPGYADLRFVAAPPADPIRAEFTLRQSSGLESTSPARIEVVLSRPVPQGMTVQVSYTTVFGGTATGNGTDWRMMAKRSDPDTPVSLLLRLRDRPADDDARASSTVATGGCSCSGAGGRPPLRRGDGVGGPIDCR